MEERKKERIIERKTVKMMLWISSNFGNMGEIIALIQIQFKIVYSLWFEC